MQTSIRRGRWLTLALIAVVTAPLQAQVSTGNVYGTVTDESAAVLPGVAVTLSGPYGTRTTTTGTQGEFRFLNLDQGRYTVKTSLTGFGHLTREVTVNTGANINLDFRMKVATVEETVTITAEAPIVDTKKVGTSTTITKEEIAQIPNARDPWAMLRTVPGVIMDRVNIGGNENGQQANFVGKGDNGDNVMWNLDGVVITDTAALSSPAYYDFDAFEEISISTGGSDLRAQTGGIGINLVTRRGTNKFRGSLHGYLTHDDFQSNNLPAELVGDPRLQGAEKGDHIQQISDYGFDVGGPIIKDKLWFYGSWGKQDVRLIRITQTSDKTKLNSYNAKLNWQPAANDMFSAFFFSGVKSKDGRPVGIAGIQEEDSFLWNQGSAYAGGPHGFLKGEWNHTFSPNFFLSSKYSYNNTGGFFLHPRGGDVNGTIDFDNGVARGSYISADITRPAHTANVDANYFKSGAGGSHEFKFGFGYRKFNVTSTTHWGGNQLFSYIGGGTGYVHVSRDAKNATQADYWSGYAGDTFTKGKMTLNLGVRWDKQTSKNLPSSVPASRSFPNILGPINFDGNTPKISWSDISPRAGLTFALDESRKTVVRASYARYASQLPSGQAAFLAPAPSPGAYFAYLWDDNNHDGFAQPSEVRTDLGLQYFNYVNVNDPNGPSSNRLDPDYKAQHDSEFIAGLEREVFANFAVSAAYTYRRATDATGWTPRTGFTAADYTRATFSRNGFTATGYVPDSQKVLASGGSRTLGNRPDYHRDFHGFEASLIKRLSNRWMARVAFTYNNPREYIDGPGAISNPTRSDTDVIGNFSSVSGPQVDGGAYPTRSGGSGKGDAFINAKWQLVANALVQLPAGFDLSAAFFSRQGHPRPIVSQQVLGFEGRVRILTDQNPELDTLRLPSVYNLDLRLAKNLKVGASSFVLSADLFNVFNANTELSRARLASSRLYNKATGAGSFNRLDEILNPRVFRLGLRFQF